MSRARARADRINEEVRIIDMLVHYGYRIQSDGGDHEQQFSCDLHGDGHDNTPSARAYPGGNSFYCFACDQTRDPIELVREKEGLSFWDAMRFIEKMYDLPRLPWEDDEDEVMKGPSVEEAIRDSMRFKRTYEEEVGRLRTFLDGLTTDRDLPMKTLLSLWEAYDKICYLVEQKAISENKGKEGLLHIRQRALEKLQGVAET